MTILSTGLSKIIQPKTTIEIVGKLGTEVLDSIPGGPPSGLPPLAACPTIWTSQTHPGNGAGGDRVTFNGNALAPFYVAGGHDASNLATVAWSTNGKDWTAGVSGQSAAPPDHIFDVAYDDVNNKWIAVGDYGGYIGNSSDGKTFTQCTYPAQTTFEAIECSGGRCVVVGTNSQKALITDDGGTTWYQSGNFTYAGHSKNIAVNGTTWLCGHHLGWIHISTDNGVTWTYAANSPIGDADTQPDMIYDSFNALWVLIKYNSGNIYTSPDGTTWTLRHSSGNILRRLASAADFGCLIAGGVGGYAVQSEDAITWTPISIGITEDIGGIAFGDTEVVVIGSTQIYVGT
jgi:hypothetical protein